MQSIEPTGMARIEWYFARLIAVVKSAVGTESIDWRTELIGYEPHESTPEELLEKLERFERLNGSY